MIGYSWHYRSSSPKYGQNAKRPIAIDNFGWFPSSCLETLILQVPAWPFFAKLELQNPIPKRELGNEQTVRNISD